MNHGNLDNPIVLKSLNLPNPTSWKSFDLNNFNQYKMESIFIIHYYALSFYRSQNVLCRSKFFVLDQKFIYILCQSQTCCAQPKRWFAFSTIGFCAGTKVVEEALNAVKFLGCLKKFGPAQNILRPIKGQGIRILILNQKWCKNSRNCTHNMTLY